MRALDRTLTSKLSAGKLCNVSEKRTIRTELTTHHISGLREDKQDGVSIGSTSAKRTKTISCYTFYYPDNCGDNYFHWSSNFIRYFAASPSSQFVPLNCRFMKSKFAIKKNRNWYNLINIDFPNLFSLMILDGVEREKNDVAIDSTSEKKRKTNKAKNCKIYWAEKKSRKKKRNEKFSDHFANVFFRVRIV